MKKLLLSLLFAISLKVSAQCPWSFTITNNSGTYTLTCINPTISLSAIHNCTNAVSYLWTGPSFTSNVSTATVSSPGNYSLVLTDIVTTCSTMQTFAVSQNTTVPTMSVTPSIFSVTCLSGPPTFTGTVYIPSSNIQQDWYGPSNPFPGPPIATSNNTISILSGGLAPGIYTLITTNLLSGCTSQQTVQVAIVYATFAYTVMPGGVVNFQSTTSGTSISTNFSWNFGDGTSGSGAATSHTYSNGGVHNVLLTLSNPSCQSTLTPINVNTIPCVANSNFTLTYSGAPQVWNAYPSYFGNVTNAQWNWGDGQTSNTLFTSHTYSAAGNYSICLSVTVSCAGTSSTCSAYNIFKSVNTDQAMVTINVLSYALGLKADAQWENVSFNIFPNPVTSKLHIKSDGIDETKTIVTISNIMGQEIYHSAFKEEIDLSNFEKGIYFLSIKEENYSKTVKIVKE